MTKTRLKIKLTSHQPACSQMLQKANCSLHFSHDAPMTNITQLPLT